MPLADITGKAPTKCLEAAFFAVFLPCPQSRLHKDIVSWALFPCSPHVVLLGFSSVYFVSRHFACFPNHWLHHEASENRWHETNSCSCVSRGSQRVQGPGLPALGTRPLPPPFPSPSCFCLAWALEAGSNGGLSQGSPKGWMPSVWRH